MAGQTFSHVNTLSRRGGTKILTAHALVYSLTKILNRPARERFNMETNINMANSIDVSEQSAILDGIIRWLRI